jgi:hypothetical protein
MIEMDMDDDLTELIQDTIEKRFEVLSDFEQKLVLTSLLTIEKDSKLSIITVHMMMWVHETLERYLVRETKQNADSWYTVIKALKQRVNYTRLSENLVQYFENVHIKVTEAVHKSLKERMKN